MAASPALLLLTAFLPWHWIPGTLGRLHLVALHFPVALLLLAGLIEMLHAIGRMRDSFPLRLVLFLATASAVGASAFGYLLRRADDAQGDLLARHAWGGLIVAAISLLALGVYLYSAGRTWMLVAYRLALATSCLLLVVVAHEGASLTHGKGYLTKYMGGSGSRAIARTPSFPKDIPVEQWDVYANAITPILQSRCYSCHDSSNAKGKLALDRWSAVMRGGASGAVISAGKPGDSSLLGRILLPLEDDDHMPPLNRPQPTKEEVQLLQQWIAIGAPEHAAVASLGGETWLQTVKQLPLVLSAPQHAPMREDIGPAAIAKARAPLASRVADLQVKFPGVVNYVSRRSAELAVNASLLGAQFGDEDLAAFAPLAAQIASLDLAATKVTDRSGALIARMPRLKVLRLNGTGITDQTVKQCVELHQLESLSLYGTAVSQAIVPILAERLKLKHLYLPDAHIPVK